MAKVDKVHPLKFENAIDGTEVDEYQAELDPLEDYVDVKGITFENSDNHKIDLTASEITFRDTVNGSILLGDLLNDSGSVVVDHIADSSIHFAESSINHNNIQNIGNYSHSGVDAHIDDNTIHFSEDSINHSNIQNIGIYSHSGIDSHIADSDIHGRSLDDAYDRGHTINVDHSSVYFNQTNDLPPHLYNVVSSAPTAPKTGTTSYAYKSGISYNYDQERSKWLSTEEISISFGVEGKNQSAQYLFYNGILPSLYSAEKLKNNATLISIAVDTETIHYSDYIVQEKNDLLTNLATFTVNTLTGDSGNFNVDLNKDDVPIVYMEPVVGKVDYPVCVLKLKYRL